LSGQDEKIEFTSFFDALTIEQLATIMKNAQTLDEIGQYEEAVSWYDIAIKKNPRDIVAWYNKGNVLDNMGKLKESIFCYDKVLEIIPNDISSMYNKAIVLLLVHQKKLVNSIFSSCPDNIYI